MRPRVSVEELRIRAARCGLRVQHECGGYRFVQDTPEGGQRDVFPSGGVCRTVPARELELFLRGVEWGKLKGASK